MRFSSRLTTLGFAVFILIAWEGVVWFYEVPRYYFPPPSVIALELADNYGLLTRHLVVTMTEAILGFLLGNTLAVVVAAIFSLSKPLREGLLPILIALQAVPIVALAPFVQIWFGSGLVGKVFLAAMICYFPSVIIAVEGFARVNREAFAFLDSLGSSKIFVFRVLRIPSAIPSIIASLEVSATLCTVGAVVAELAGASQGIGYLIVRASFDYDTGRLFASLVVLSFATYLLYYGVKTLGAVASRRYRLSFAQGGG